MPQNFRSCDRDQALLLSPDLRDWLDEDHLAWFVIEAVDELDLEPFYGAYRADGHGRAAHEPKMMVTLFAYAYAVGERSSRLQGEPGLCPRISSPATATSRCSCRLASGSVVLILPSGISGGE